MRISIRQATDDDALEIARVHAASFMAAHQGLIPRKVLAEITKGDFVGRWERRLKEQKGCTYIAEAGKKVAGLVSFLCDADQNTAEVLLLYIKPRYWRKGIGKRLVSFVLSVLQKQGIREVTIWALKNNPESRAFYESIGATTDGTERVVNEHHISTQQIKYCLAINQSEKNNRLWEEAWEEGEIGFHRDETHPDLLQYHRLLGDLSHKRILVPLCGKSHDLLWFLSQGAEVVGVELSPIAADAFFSENTLTPKKQQREDPPFVIYRYEALTFFCGDFFQLRATDVGPIDLVYDKAALIALSEKRRIDYVNRLTALLSSGGQMLLTTLEYETTSAQLPPYSVTEGEVHHLFADHFDIDVLYHKKNVALAPHLAKRALKNVQKKLYLLTKRPP